jgi:hypothetical protein
MPMIELPRCTHAAGTMVCAAAHPPRTPRRCRGRSCRGRACACRRQGRPASVAVALAVAAAAAAPGLQHSPPPLPCPAQQADMLASEQLVSSQGTAPVHAHVHDTGVGLEDGLRAVACSRRGNRGRRRGVTLHAAGLGLDAGPCRRAVACAWHGARHACPGREPAAEQPTRPQAGR